jgi:hypothetical protein
VESNNGDATVGNLTGGKLSPVKPPLCSYVVDAWVQLTAGPDVSACVCVFEMFFFILFRECLSTFKNHYNL